MVVGHFDSSGTGIGRLSRYDLVLVAVPVAFLLAATAGTLASVPLRVALSFASLFGAALVADALFVHPPIDH